ncbi:hypothetical protein Pint_11812 [Pistacia integerrima]|uniref:Uncharacterized protein n=1 Tax=Pistacia integerrima TaxID=434235 RepID=A0ACC0XLN3_9ROSI|nr:hypothetical protein Pint_11812 [Pistacia integerrima]
MEMPLELMITIRQKLPRMFFPDIMPIGHPIFDIINSTDPEEDLLELQDPNLASTMRKQQQRALEFWGKDWHNGVPLKIKRLARDPERFMWAMSIVQSRCINMQIRIGALDRMLEVMINAGQRVKKGEEVRPIGMANTNSRSN